MATQYPPGLEEQPVAQFNNGPQANAVDDINAVDDVLSLAAKYKKARGKN